MPIKQPLSFGQTLIVNVSALILAIVFIYLLFLNKAVETNQPLLNVADLYSNELGVSLTESPIKLAPNFPRIIPLLPSENALLKKSIRKEFKITPEYYCNKKSVKYFVACLRFSPTKDNIDQAIKLGLSFKVSKANLKGNSGNAWILALLIDQLMPHVNDSQQNQIREIKKKLSKELNNLLILLDGDSASLWHGRFGLAANAFILSSIVGADEPIAMNRAHTHFLDAVLALEITEAWPNGYNYWINNRALPFLLASMAYINGTDGPHKQRIINLVYRIGLWQIYMTRPDNRIEAIGDGGSRVDLKDESRRVIDLIAKITNNSIFASYAQYIQNLHGSASYFRGHRWMLPLTYLPSLNKTNGPVEDLSIFNGVLPSFMVFGQGAYNQVVMRSGWGKNDSFIQIRGGANFSHHQHYDAGHFSVYYKKPVIVDAAVNSRNYFKPSRLNFSIRSVSKNTLLLPMKGEEIKPNRFFEDNVNPGGQKIIAPTGSAVTSVAQWRDQEEKYKSATLLRQVAIEHAFSFVEFDLTHSYQTTTKKAEQVTRSLLYLPRTQNIMVFDRLVNVKANIKAKSQLHLALRPEVDNKLIKDHESVYLFNSNKNILLADSNVSISLLLPQASSNRIYDGEDSRFVVESYEENETQFKDQRASYVNKKWFDNPKYRIEWQQSNAIKNQNFVQVISLEKNTELPAIVEDNKQYRVYKLDHTLVIEYLQPLKNIVLSDYHDVDELLVIAPSWIKDNTILIANKKYSVELKQGIGYIKITE